MSKSAGRLAGSQALLEMVDRNAREPDRAAAALAALGDHVLGAATVSVPGRLLGDL
ncbi:MAG TPA: hypothetical protein VFW18_05730 [Gaiellales bacterium]|nr:hypothetical protein [Gaiellales bacterium]